MANPYVALDEILVEPDTDIEEELKRLEELAKTPDVITVDDRPGDLQTQYEAELSRLAEAAKTIETQTGEPSRLREHAPAAPGLDQPLPERVTHTPDERLPQDHGDQPEVPEIPLPTPLTRSWEGDTFKGGAAFGIYPPMQRRNPNLPMPATAMPPMLDQALEPVRQGASGLLGTTAALPWNILAGVSGLASIPAEKFGYTGPTEAGKEFLSRGRQASEFMRNAVGAKKPGDTNIIEELTHLAGGSVMGKTLPAAVGTGLATGVQYVAEHGFPWKSQAQTLPGNVRPHGNDERNRPYVVPVLPRNLNPVIVQPRGNVLEGGVLKQEPLLPEQLPEEAPAVPKQLIPEGTFGPSPFKDIPFYKDQKNFTPEERAAYNALPKKEFDKYWSGLTRAKVNFKGREVVSTVVHRIQSQGGPIDVNEDELATLGYATLLTVGMLWSPKLWQRFATANQSILLPRLRPVTNNAAPGTLGVSNVGDYLRTQDDANAGLMRIMDRANHLPLNESQRIKLTFGLQTRSQARGLVDAAISTGDMRTPSFTFHVNTPIARLREQDSTVLNQYLHLHDTREQLRVRSRQTLNLPLSQRPATLDLHGHDLPSVTRAIADMEMAHPDLRQQLAVYRENLKELRRFMGDGEAGTMPASRRRFLGSYRPTEVPGRAVDAVYDPAEKVTAVQRLQEAMRRRMVTRLENEAKLLYVDGMRRYNEGIFQGSNPQRPLSNIALRKNQRDAEGQRVPGTWAPNTVSIMRRGKTEKYTTEPFLADVLNMDPYYITDSASLAWYYAKRATEVTTTGKLAPWFAFTGPVRNFNIIKQSTDPGRASGSVLGSLKAVPTQWVMGSRGTEMAIDATVAALQRGSGGWLGATFGQANVRGLATRIANSYHNSLWTQIESRGGLHTAYNSERVLARTKLHEALQDVNRPLSVLLSGYSRVLDSMHNAAAYSYVQRNVRRGVPIDQAVREAQNITGDPRVAGMYKGAGGRPVRFESDHWLQQAVTPIAKGYGLVSDLMRTGGPWFNVTLQGAKRVAEAYNTNPVGFTGKAFLYTQLPAAMSVMWSHALGKDPNGQSYADFHRNRIDPYRKLMNIYVAIPGQPAERGVFYPIFHEVAPLGAATVIATDHFVNSRMYRDIHAQALLTWFGDRVNALWDTDKQPKPPNQQMRYENTDKILPIGDRIRSLVSETAQTVIIPPVPPVVGLGASTMGMVTPGGMFGGEAYRIKPEPHDPTRGLPVAIEGFLRGMYPGVADIFGQVVNAYQVAEGSSDQTGGELLHAAGRRMIQKAPLIRDIVGIKPPVAGNTEVTEKLFAKKRGIDDLLRYSRQWEDDLKGGLLNIKGVSTGGAAIADQLLGKGPPITASTTSGDYTPVAGYVPPPPDNPLYKRFLDLTETKIMEYLNTSFKKDSPFTSSGLMAERGAPTGSLGYNTLWRKYGNATAQIRSLNKVNVSSGYAKWQDDLNSQPKLVEYLQGYGVDTKDLEQVKNFYLREKDTTGRVILMAIESVEAELSKMLGRKIKLEDLSPYVKKKDANAPENDAPVASEDQPAYE